MADPDGSPSPRTPRRRWVYVVGAAVAVLLLVVMPGFLGTRTGFFGRSESLAMPYKTWASSTHAEISCQDCHVRPRFSSRTAYAARMVGEFYLGVFSSTRRPDVFGQPTNDACLVCHSDLRTVSPKGDLRIPHRAHVEVLEMKCVECHSFVVHEKSPEGKHTPSMAGCLKCHDGETAKDDCSACHTEKAAPKTHATATWLVVHAGNADDPECATCHKWAGDWCAECHSQRPRSHGKDWRQVHGDSVSARRNCETCHEAAFCVKCHGELPKRNLDPAMKLVR